MTNRWDIDRLLLNPKVAVQELNDNEPRIADLLEANNRYQQEARDARAALKVAETQAREMARVALANGEALLKAEAKVKESHRLHVQVFDDRAIEIRARQKAEADRKSEQLVREAAERMFEAAADKADGLQADLAKAVSLIQWAHDTLYEINPSNYDHNEVCKLNDASVEVIIALAAALGKTHGKTAEWWADYMAKHLTPPPLEWPIDAPQMDRVIEAISDVLIDADVDYPAGREAGHRIEFDDAAMRAAIMRAVATPAPSTPTPQAVEPFCPLDAEPSDA